MKQELEQDQGLPLFIRRHWRAMVLAFTVVMVAGVASYPFLPRKYTSQAKLMIVRADQRMGGAKVIEDDIPELTGASHPLYTQAQILRIESVLTNAIKSHDLKGKDGLPLSTGELDAGYGVFPVKGTDIIDLTMVSDTAAHSHDRLAALCDSYFEHIQKYRKEGVREGLNYLEEQLQLAKKQLEESEDRLQAFKRVSGSISLTSEIEAAVRDYSDVNSTIRSQRLALESAQARASGLRGKLGMSAKDALDFAAIAQNPRIKFLQEQILAAETSPIRSRGLKPDHPEMRALTQREQMLKEEMSREIQRLIGRNLPFRALDDIRLEALRQLTSAQTEILSLQAALSAAEQSRTRLADGMTSIPERERKLVGLKRDAEVAGQVYQQLLQKRSEARLSLANNLAYAYLIEAPTLPGQPSYPLFKHLLLFLLAMGLTGAFGTGLLLEFIDQIRNAGRGMPQAPLLATLPILSRLERRGGE
ncbi:MAG: GumC family protein, partial [Bacteroidota bacterium]